MADEFERDALIGIVKSKRILQAAVNSSLEPIHFTTGFGRWLYRHAVEYGKEVKFGGDPMPLKVAKHKALNDKRLDETERVKYVRLLKKYYSQEIPKASAYGVEALNKQALKQKFLAKLEEAVGVIESTGDVDTAMNTMSAMTFSSMQRDGVEIVD